MSGRQERQGAVEAGRGSGVGSGGDSVGRITDILGHWAVGHSLTCLV